MQAQAQGVGAQTGSVLLCLLPTALLPRPHVDKLQVLRLPHDSGAKKE